MQRTPNAAVAALIVLLALLLGGCGGDDSSDFRDDYQAAIERLNRANSEIQRKASAEDQTNAQIAADFRRTAEAFETTRTDLSSLDPPASARDEYGRMLSALATSVYDLRAAGEAAKASNPAAFRRAVAELSRSSRQITDSERALRKAVGS